MKAQAQDHGSESVACVGLSSAGVRDGLWRPWSLAHTLASVANMFEEVITPIPSSGALNPDQGLPLRYTHWHRIPCKVSCCIMYMVTISYNIEIQVEYLSP